ncbi:F-box protein At5g07610-like [Tasmannia lanceolata]|uniref:F-box protein At5g07610-like n=1 Tax=Tasmannia lanceolata TaxID=3420 RepID=UPI004063662D
MSFGEDMLMQILARLPAKSLHRFKCVSKEWYNLISMGALSRKILPPLMSGLFYQGLYPSGYAFVSNSKVDSGGDMDMSLSFLPCHQKLSIVNCCNGLLLCQMEGYEEFHHYIVSNPTTRKWVSLPEVHKNSCVDGLVYDPCISDQFKVVRFLCCIRENSSIKLQIFSSETGKWVESTMFSGSKVSFLFEGQCVFSNGALHVLFYPNYVLKFDIKEERCVLIELPEQENRLFHIGYLGESGGCLHYAEIINSVLEIWSLRDCRRCKWVLKHSIGLEDLVEQLPRPRSWRFSFLAFHPDLEVVFLKTDDKICYYHLNTSKLEKFGTIGQKGFPLGLFAFSPCIDTFAH